MAREKVAFITGAGKRRVGWHVARRFAERGYRLALQYRSDPEQATKLFEELRREGAVVEAFQAELTSEQAVRTLVEQVIGSCGRIDSFVHGAATWKRRKLEATHEADLRADWEANALAPFLLCQHVGLAMAKQAEGGCMTLIGDWAIERPYLDHASYFLAKGTIPTLTRVMAVELATRNPKVRVNCILPGPVMLPKGMDPQEKAAAINATLLKREGSPENVALAALHFAENDFVTGVCLPVDGGRTIYAPSDDG